MVSKIGNKYKLKGTETRADILDKIGGSGGGSRSRSLPLKDTNSPTKSSSSKWKEGIKKLKIKTADRVGSSTTKKLTKLFDEAMNPKPRKAKYSQLSKKEKTDLATGKGNYSYSDFKKDK